MCLKTTTNELKVAEEDIVVYKRLEFYYKPVGKPAQAVSPFQDYRYIEGVQQPTVEIYFRTYIPIRYDPVYCSEKQFTVDPGYHSFVNPDESYWICIIPKGTKYVQGDFNRHYSIASESIIWTGKLYKKPKPPTGLQKAVNYLLNFFN